MIRLLTGKPGAGKTTLMLVYGKAYKDEGREVYVHGIKDLQFDAIGFKYLEKPTEWESLPDGSVVLLDEAYSTFPNRNPGSKVPPHVDAMARHRHRGFDFVLGAQQGMQLDPFLRGLYDSHEHLIKAFGKKTTVKRWECYESNAQKAVCSDKRTWLRPSWPHQYFTSTVMDTSKLHVPMWLRYMMLAIALLVGTLWFVKHRAEAQIAQAKIEHAGGATAGAPRSVAAAGATAGRATSIAYQTADDYHRALTPRVNAAPWTAPAFDGRAVVADPHLYCMASGAGVDGQGHHAGDSCRCVTEQGTPMTVGPATCRRIAREGEPYNPFKSPSKSADFASPGREADTHDSPVPADAGTETASAGGGGQSFGTVAAYGDLGLK